MTIIVCTRMMHAQHRPPTFIHPHAHTLFHTHINQSIIPSINLSLHLTLFDSLPISLSFIPLIQSCHTGHSTHKPLACKPASIQQGYSGLKSALRPFTTKSTTLVHYRVLLLGPLECSARLHGSERKPCSIGLYCWALFATNRAF